MPLGQPQGRRLQPRNPKTGSRSICVDDKFFNRVCAAAREIQPMITAMKRELRKWELGLLSIGFFIGFMSLMLFNVLYPLWGSILWGLILIFVSMISSSTESVTAAREIQPTITAMKHELRKWALGLLFIGFMSLMLFDVLDPLWGLILIDVGIVVFLFRVRPMFLVAGLVVIVAGILNTFVHDLGLGTIVGIAQAVCGFVQIGRFNYYKNALPEANRIPLLKRKVLAVLVLIAIANLLSFLLKNPHNPLFQDEGFRTLLGNNFLVLFWTVVALALCGAFVKTWKVIGKNG
jgi:hypothetical protein